MAATHYTYGEATLRTTFSRISIDCRKIINGKQWKDPRGQKRILSVSIKRDQVIVVLIVVPSATNPLNDH